MISGIGQLGRGFGKSFASIISPPVTDLPYFFFLATVPYQTVTTDTFEVQALAETLDPNAGAFVAPVVIDASSVSHTMTKKRLKWPGTTEDSIEVWSATVPLLPNQVNNLSAVSGTTTLSLSVRHKAALSVVTATDSATLITAVKAAIANAATDVVEMAYNETDLGSTLNNIISGVTNNRVTWLTVKPATGYSATWIQDTTAPRVNQRPGVNFLNIDGVIFGSDTSDGAAGTYYIEPNQHVWISHCEFRSKYKYTWAKATPMTAATVPNVRGSHTDNLHQYFTDCLWDGTASNQATNIIELGRDLRFNSHRGDINNFGKVMLNMYAQDMETVRNNTNTDYLHNDTFQIWGGTNTSSLIFKGLKAISPNIASDIQPTFFDAAANGGVYPNYVDVMVDSIFIEGALTSSTLQAQFFGWATNCRISNYSMPAQTLSLRYDSVATQGAFKPTNCYMSDMSVKLLNYQAAAGHTTVSYTHANVVDPNNISPELTANVDLNGMIYTRIKVNT